MESKCNENQETKKKNFKSIKRLSNRVIVGHFEQCYVYGFGSPMKYGKVNMQEFTIMPTMKIQLN